MSDRLSHLADTAAVVYDVRIDVSHEAYRTMVVSSIRSKVNTTLAALGLYDPTLARLALLPAMSVEQRILVETVIRGTIDRLHGGILRASDGVGSCTYLPDEITAISQAA